MRHRVFFCCENCSLFYAGLYFDGCCQFDGHELGDSTKHILSITEVTEAVAGDRYVTKSVDVPGEILELMTETPAHRQGYTSCAQSRHGPGHVCTSNGLVLFPVFLR